MPEDRPGTDGDPLARASRQVDHIVKAAEQAADQLLRETEERANERIAEATRAADNRVEAAEAEAAELIADAQRQAAVLHETATADAARIREEAERAAAARLEEASRQAEEMQRIAEVFAVQTREGAEQEASKQIRRARELAGEVLSDGTEMSHNLGQLADSLRRNAETLLRDVSAAHRALTSKLDDSGLDAPPESGEPVVRRTKSTGLPRAESDFGVPEFIPSSPRRSG